MSETLLSIPYGCLVDEFLHRVYDQPRLTGSERRAIWRELESIYLPDLDYGEEPCYTSGCSWMLESQIFLKPFSLFDDVIARIAALEIWQQAREEPAQAWQRYDKLCSLGGRETFGRLLEQAGLKSPFHIGTVKVVAYAAARFMEL
jgi:oligoendopeptidase F